MLAKIVEHARFVGAYLLSDEVYRFSEHQTQLSLPPAASVYESCSQCSIFGDTSFAVRAGLIVSNQMIELGSIIENPSSGRTNDEQITVADLTGVAIQDLQIAITAYTALLASQYSAIDGKKTFLALIKKFDILSTD
jgi:ornithine cyclodeaminase/alanine dehydrogenase-like protein (mu-crystallin family)